MPELEARVENSFVLLGRELKQRIARPVSHFSFWVFILLGVIIFGGIAVWVELIKFIPGVGGEPRIDNLRTAIDTYFPAIGCAAAVQLAFEGESKKFLVSFGYLITVFFAISSVLMILLERQAATPFSWVAGVACCVLAIFMWWIANGLDRTFQDVNPEAPLGGPVETPLRGDTTGFNVQG